eukprot:1472983-Amphidinium_carterae.2
MATALVISWKDVGHTGNNDSSRKAWLRVCSAGSADQAQAHMEDLDVVWRMCLEPRQVKHVCVRDSFRWEGGHLADLYDNVSSSSNRLQGILDI